MKTQSEKAKVPDSHLNPQAKDGTKIEEQIQNLEERIVWLETIVLSLLENTDTSQKPNSTSETVSGTSTSTIPQVRGKANLDRSLLATQPLKKSVSLLPKKEKTPSSNSSTSPPAHLPPLIVDPAVFQLRITEAFATLDQRLAEVEKHSSPDKDAEEKQFRPLSIKIIPELASTSHRLKTQGDHHKSGLESTSPSMISKLLSLWGTNEVLPFLHRWYHEEYAQGKRGDAGARGDLELLIAIAEYFRRIPR